MEAEGRDRYYLGFAPVQQNLLSAIRNATKGSATKVVLLVESAGPIALDPSDADAILWVGYGGEEAGSGAADVLWGDVNPSARLPLTMYAADYLSKVGPILDYSTTSGVGRTYRYLTEAPIFMFGYGLSYTTFAYSNLGVDMTSKGLRVSATIKNTGNVDGAEVVQVYVSVPKVPNLPTPRIALQAFDKVRRDVVGAQILRRNACAFSPRVLCRRVGHAHALPTAKMYLLSYYRSLFICIWSTLSHVRR